MEYPQYPTDIYFRKNLLYCQSYQKIYIYQHRHLIQHISIHQHESGQLANNLHQKLCANP